MVEAQREKKMEKHLNTCILKGGLVELHTHLMGMGSHDFWATRIMQGYLPAVFTPTEFNSLADVSKALVKEHTKRVFMPPTVENFTTKEEAWKIHFELNPDGNAFVKGLGWEEDWDVNLFTMDVVYPMEDLCAGFGIIADDVEVDVTLKGPKRAAQQALRLQKQTIELESLFNAVPSKRFDEICKRQIVYNQRKEKFTQIFGISNTDLVECMEKSVCIKARVRNCFGFLGANGDDPDEHDVGTRFRGQFTTAFYPQRFILKDSIYGQRLEVLAILLNHVLGRYKRAGVGYVEFSISARDVTDIRILQTMVFDTYVIQDVTRNPGKFHQFISANQMFGVTVGAAYNGCGLPRGNAKTRETSWAQDFGSYNSRGNSAPDFRFLAALSRYPLDPNVTGNLTPFQVLKALADTDKTTDMGFPNNVFKPQTLERCAEALCSDSCIETMYPSKKPRGLNFQDLIDVLDNCFTREGKTSEKLTEAWLFRNFVVGLDWVGDEMCVPMCALAHKNVTDAVCRWHQFNSRFGVRVHAGEQVLRPSKANSPEEAKDASETLGDMFYLNMLTLMQGIWRIVKGLSAETTNETGDDDFPGWCSEKYEWNKVKPAEAAMAQAKKAAEAAEMTNKAQDALNAALDAACAANEAAKGSKAAVQDLASFKEAHEKLKKAQEKVAEAAAERKGGLAKAAEALAKAEILRLAGKVAEAEKNVGEKVAEATAKAEAFSNSTDEVNVPADVAKCAVDAAAEALAAAEAEAKAKAPRIPLRIGHGVAFCITDECLTDYIKDKKLGDHLTCFRRMLEHYGVPLEINPTSNNMLLFDSYSSEGISTAHSANGYYKLNKTGSNLKAVLCTDNDGIWAITKCKKHHLHVSVAAEICMCIRMGYFQDIDDLERVIETASDSTFVDRPGKRKREESGDVSG